MKHKVYLSHAEQDEELARLVCSTLEAADLKCWMAARNLRPNRDRQAAVKEAIDASKIVIVIYTENANSANEMPSELNFATNARVKIIPFMVDDSPPAGVMQYYLSDTQWLEADNPPTNEQLNNLATTVSLLLESETKDQGLPLKSRFSGLKLRRAWAYISAVTIVLAFAVFIYGGISIFQSLLHLYETLITVIAAL